MYAVSGEEGGLEKTIEVFQTAGEPARIGRIIFATTRWTWKTRDAPRRIADKKTKSITRLGTTSLPAEAAFLSSTTL